MLKLRITYLLLFIFCTWLALATRSHHEWFHPLIVEYGGDIIWSGMFVFFLRICFVNTALWKLALINYILGVLDEFSQLSHAGWIVAARHTYLGRLLLGVGFLWSDLLCYAIGTLIAWGIALLVDKLKGVTRHKKYYKIPGLQTK
jgi:Protein of unknown function (DUF2809)